MTPRQILLIATMVTFCNSYPLRESFCEQPKPHHGTPAAAIPSPQTTPTPGTREQKELSEEIRESSGIPLHPEPVPDDHYAGMDDLGDVGGDFEE